MGATYEPLSEFAELAKGCDPTEFGSRIGVPVFVIYPFSTGSDGEDATASVQTLFVSAERRQIDAVRVARIQKRGSANSFADMVTIGRARNNDLVFKSPSVSKFHAYVRKGFDGNYSLTDAGSSFGTILNGAKLDARVATPLSARDEVLLGEAVRLVFVTPDLLHGFVSGQG